MFPGDFHTAEHLDLLMADRPDERDAIKANSHTMICTITGKTMHWKPTYSLCISNEETDSMTQKREVEGEQAIKKATAKQLASLEAAEAGRAVEGGEPPPPKKRKTTNSDDTPKPLNEAVTKRLEKVIPKLEDSILKITTKLATAETPEKAGLVGIQVLAKAKQIKTDLEEALKEATSLYTLKRARKGEAASVFDLVKQASAQVKQICTKIEEDVGFGQD